MKTLIQVLAENDIGKTASPWVSQKTGEATPISTPTPNVYSVSHTQLELQWKPPSEDQARGIITTYKVYFYTQNDLNTNPYAPPYMWKVGSYLIPRHYNIGLILLRLTVQENILLDLKIAYLLCTAICLYIYHEVTLQTPCTF